MTTLKPVLLLMFTAAFSFSAIAQLDTAALSAKLEQSKKQLGKNMVFALYKDGKVVYKKETGDYNIRMQQPIHASSQWLTAAAVLTFVQEGKLSLDDKVSDYLPIFARYSKSYITIRHCLTHQTGIQGEGGRMLKGKYKTLEEEVNDFASKRDIMTNPGTEFNYSNVGMNIAARVLEIIARRPFDRIVVERITRPLTMRTTTFMNEDYNSAINPSNGGKSSAVDMTNFMAMLINKGKFNNKQVLTEESVATLLGLLPETLPLKNMPKAAEGWPYTMGSWVMETSANGPSALTSPSTGVWPVVDLCRGYAFIVFSRPSSEPPREAYLSIKQFIDGSLPANDCN